MLAQRSHLRNSDLDIATGNRRIDRLHHEVNCAPDSRPTRGRQYHDGHAPIREVLLIAEISIGRDQHDKAVGLGRIEQTTVLQLSPATLICRGDLMVGQETTQGCRGTLIKKDPHLRRRQGTACGVLKHRANLLDGDAREPFDKLGRLRTVLKVLEQSCNR